MVRGADEGNRVGAGRAWFAVVVLMIAYTSSFVDRQVLTLLVEPIRRDLVISDTQFSLLAGLAFSLFYTLLGIPVAKLADGGSRRMIVLAGIVVWSVMTVACGLANGFWALFAARLGVGIGEATLSPSAYSMIADYFPPDRRARALAVYSIGPYLGAGLALMIGGATVALIERAGTLTLPGVGVLAPWQKTFVLVGAPGLLIAALFLAVREPPRRDDGHADAEVGVLAFMWARRATFGPMILGFSIFGICGISYLTWMPAVLIRGGWAPADAGFAYGAVLLGAAIPGVLVGGWATGRLARRRPDAPLATSLIALLAALPFAAATPLLPAPAALLASLAAFTFCAGVLNSLPATALQAISPGHFRARITAIYFLVGNLISLGIGPTLVAAVSDRLLGGPAMIGTALAIVGGVSIAAAALLLARSLPAYRACLAASAQRSMG